jgi:lysophospholipase L1-like esterase
MTAPAHPRRSVASGLLAFAFALIGLAALEGVLRLFPSPAPPLSPATVLERQGGLEELEREVLREAGGAPDPLRANRVYMEDARTFWRVRPSVRIEAKNYLLPLGVRERFPFTMTTNRMGFRGEILPREKPAGVLRVIAVGNSSTFGWGVEDGETYPASLSPALGRVLPGRRIEVMNAGVPGFASFQGRRLLEEEVLPLSPDFVVLAFGFNDSRRAASTDSAFAVAAAAPAARAARLVRHLEIYRRLERLVGRARPADRLSPTAEERTVERVPVREYESNMREMVRACAAARARPILLAMVIPPEYRDALLRVARKAGVPFLETRPYLLARVQEPGVRAALTGEIARHEEAWRLDTSGGWHDPAYVDKIHPSALGHALIAEWVARTIAEAQATPGAGRSP